MAAISPEAFNDRLVLFEVAHDLAETDRPGRAGKLEAAPRAALGFHIARVGQALHDLGQVVPRNLELFRNLIGRE
jgi:hypothetical protein